MKQIILVTFLIGSLLSVWNSCNIERNRILSKVSYALPLCDSEGDSNCAWQAEKLGNKVGTSFVDLGGEVFYYDQ